MRRREFGWHWVAAFKCIALLSVASNAVAGSDPTESALRLGADYIAGVQGTYMGTISTNTGIILAPAVANVWEHNVGSRVAEFPVWTQPALGLGAASDSLGDPALAEGVVRFARSMRDDFRDIGAFLRSRTSPIPADIELFGWLGGTNICRFPRPPRLPASERSAYALAAEDWMKNLRPPTDEVDAIIERSVKGEYSNRVGISVGHLIRGALSAGDVSYACTAAERVIDRRPDWENGPNGFSTDWDHGYAEGELAFALSMIETAGGCRDFSAEIRGFRDQLMARQSGPFVEPAYGIDREGAVGAMLGLVAYSTRHSALGIVGMLGCGDGAATDADIQSARRMVGYLLRTQYPPGTGAVIRRPTVDPRPADGGWPFLGVWFRDNSNSEVDGQALYALAVARARGAVPPTSASLPGGP